MKDNKHDRETELMIIIEHQVKLLKVLLKADKIDPNAILIAARMLKAYQEDLDTCLNDTTSLAS
jgi:hypothetical protein